MIKTRVITTFILFAFIFTYLQATPLNLPPNIPKIVGKAQINFLNLKGAFTFTLDDLGLALKIDGEFEKGIDDNTPDNYLIGFPEIPELRLSFHHIGLPINPPKAGPLSRKFPTFPGILNLIINHNLTVYKGADALDTATIVEA